MNHNLALVSLAIAIASAAPASAEETVAVPAFRSIQLVGGGSVTVRPGGRQRVIFVTGSSRFTPIRVEEDGRLRIQACSYPCPRGYRLKIVIETPRVPDLAVNGGGEIVATTGFALQPQLSAAIRGGGTIDARHVAATSVSAAVMGGGDIKVQPRAALTAAVRGGGDIRFSGNPRVTSAVAGGGSVRRLR